VRTKFDIYVFIMMYKQMYSPQCMMFDTLVYRIAVSRIRTLGSSKRFKNQIAYKYTIGRKQNSRKTNYGHLYLREENLSFYQKQIYNLLTRFFSDKYI
jgi:hypothetical protein